MYSIRKTIFSRAGCPPAATSPPQHSPSQLCHLGTVIWAWLAVSCSLWTHQHRSDSKPCTETGCCFLLRSFWAASKCRRGSGQRWQSCLWWQQEQRWGLSSSWWLLRIESTGGWNFYFQGADFYLKFGSNISSLFLSCLSNPIIHSCSLGKDIQGHPVCF